MAEDPKLTLLGNFKFPSLFVCLPEAGNGDQSEKNPFTVPTPRCLGSNTIYVDRSPEILLDHQCINWDFATAVLLLLRVTALPSGYVNIAIENGHRNSGFSH